jgi:hypothetical protein
MIPFASMLYGASYLTMGTDAELILADYGKPVAIRAIDKTGGVTVDEGKTGLSTIKPAAVVRMADLTAAGIKRNELRKASLSMNGKTFRIESTLPRPSPAGEADGELYLFLIEDNCP